MIAIYEIRNLINNKVYIGSSKQVNKRFTIHRHRLNKNTHANKYLQAAWNKYGKDAFEFKVIHILEKESDLIKYEQMWIIWTKCTDPNYGYNINPTAGSNLGYKHTEKDKAKIGARHKNKIVSQETKNRMKANHHLRNKEKWPHDKGRLCKCDECRIKNNEYRMLWKRKKRIEKKLNA
jgi:group I intron endonuclease